jgi:hypothetical protein
LDQLPSPANLNFVFVDGADTDEHGNTDYMGDYRSHVEQQNPRLFRARASSSSSNTSLAEVQKPPEDPSAARMSQNSLTPAASHGAFQLCPIAFDRSY